MINDSMFLLEKNKYNSIFLILHIKIFYIIILVLLTTLASIFSTYDICSLTSINNLKFSRYPNREKKTVKYF